MRYSLGRSGVSSSTSAARESPGRSLPSGCTPAWISSASAFLASIAPEEQVMLELIAEIRRARRVVEGESGERVDHAPAAGVAAIEGLHAEDRDYVFGRHAVLVLGALERLAVGVPERDALGNALLGEETRAVFLPGAALRRSLHRLQH